MNHNMFNLNRLNSSMGRSIRKEYIHFSNPSSEIKYEWQTYKENVMINSKPQATEHIYSKTNFYMVVFVVENKMYLYRGHTVNTGDCRLEEHKQSAMTNPTSKFHKMLALADMDQVKIFVTETRSLSNRTEAETHEMLLLEQDIKKFASSHEQMLDVRHRKKEVKEIKACDTKQIPEEEFKKITDGKQIEVHITNRESKKLIQLRYTVDGKRQTKEIRYIKCGYEEGM